MNYALITGASTGIGKAIAEELARRGHHVLLIARSEDQLSRIAGELATTYGVKTAYYATDLTSNTAAVSIFRWCQQNNYQVNVLVNNAGYGLSGPFEKYSIEENLNMMQLNMATLVEMCQLFLPVLRNQPKAYIMNIASTAAYQAVPGLSLYAATKAFVLSFSRGLRQELQKTGIQVTCISPGATATDFTVRAQIGEKGLKTAEKVNMTPQDVGKIAVNSMLEGKAEVITGFINKLGTFLVKILPKSLVEKAAMRIYE
jgi:short-subunit dehydrogenase